MSKNILITTSSFGTYTDGPIENLESHGYNAIDNPFHRKVTEQELKDLLEDNKPVGLLAGTEPITASVIKGAAAYLKVISRIGTGWNNVDHAEVQQQGIKVFRTPDATTETVAELTVGLMLNMIRNVGLMDRELRQGIWKKRMGVLLEKKKVGIIGFGRIGKRVAELLAPFKVEIAFFDVLPQEVKKEWQSLSLESLVEWADILSLHLAPPEEGKTVLDASLLRRMRKGSWLVNASRGDVVDEKALYEALQSGQLAGAALDVFMKEPYEGPFTSLDNVILTPHIGSYAREARIQMEVEAVENLLEGLGR